MKYDEYKKILDEGMVEYVNKGYSTFHIGRAMREYIFEYDDVLLSHDNKNSLTDKAIQAIMAQKPLPEGMTLIRCIWHERKV